MSTNRLAKPVVTDESGIGATEFENSARESNSAKSSWKDGTVRLPRLNYFCCKAVDC